MEQLFFYIFAFIAVVSALAVILVKNPVHSAIYLILCLLQAAALFVLLRAPFLAAVQVFIYVGAVIVLFLFVVMVLDIGKEKFGERMHGQGHLAIPVVALFLVITGYMVFKGRLTAPAGNFTESALAKNTEVLGKLLYTKYIFPFEVVSILLPVAGRNCYVDINPFSDTEFYSLRHRCYRRTNTTQYSHRTHVSGIGL
jgi:NADH-quinone oxidoreductase subunit J